MRTALVLLMLCACPASAVAAIADGPVHDISSPVAKTVDPYLTELLPGNADGDHIAVLYGERSDGASTLSGRIVSASGRPKGKAVLWSDPERSVGGSGAAIDAAGEKGLAAWREAAPDEGDIENLVVRPFDARTGKPTAEATTVGTTFAMYEVEAYRDGYAVVYSRPGSDGPAKVVQFLDADGAPDGDAREIRTGRTAFFADLARSRSASRMLMMTRGPYGSSGIALELFRPDGTSEIKRINQGDDALLEIAHASGAAFMTLWFDTKRNFYLRRLSGSGELGPRRSVGFKSGDAGGIAFNEGRGLLVSQTRTCGATAVELTSKGKVQGDVKRVPFDCEGGRVALDSGSLMPGAAGRFVYGFDTADAVFTTGLRLR